MTSTAGLLDHGLNQGSWEGLQLALSEGSLDRADYIASLDARDYRKNIEYFAARNYDLIVTVGAVQNGLTESSAQRHPDILFVGVDQTFEHSAPNLVSIRLPYDQVGFLAGWLAASMSSTATVAGICEIEGLPAMRRSCEGFLSGALFARPETRVIIRYRDDESGGQLFSDPEWAASVASGVANLGADVIFAVGGRTADGALLTAADLGLLVIGAEEDQWYALPQSRRSLVVSLYGSPTSAVRDLAALLRSGESVAGTLIGDVEIGSFQSASGPPAAELEEGLLLLLEELQSGDVQTAVE